MVASSEAWVSGYIRVSQIARATKFVTKPCRGRRHDSLECLRRVPRGLVKTPHPCVDLREWTMAKFVSVFTGKGRGRKQVLPVTGMFVDRRCLAGYDRE